MLGWLVNRKIAAFERNFDYDMEYARDMYAASPRAFWKFSKILALSEHREDVPREAWYAAKIAATLAEDCGPCTQLVVTMAERAGIKPETLRAIVAGDQAVMPENAALGWQFARSVLARDIAESDRLREKIVDRWGRRALVSLALTVASSRVYPALKYGLGYGHACVRLRVGGAELPVKAEARAAGSGR
jgi:hypothetical protein